MFNEAISKGGVELLRLVAVFAIAAAVSCSGATNPDENDELNRMAQVTVIVTGIVPELVRVDVAVTKPGVETVNGTFDTPGTNRVTMAVPLGDSLNAFARGFDGANVIQYIGDRYFDVNSQNPMEISVELKFKGPHLPIQ